MSEIPIKQGYPGICEEYRGVIFEFYWDNPSYTNISNRLYDELFVSISPTSISKFINKNLNSHPSTLLGVVSPSVETEPEPVAENSEDEKLLLSLGYDPEKYLIYGSKLWQRSPGGEYLSSYDIRLKPSAVPEPEQTNDEEKPLTLLFAEASKNLDQRFPTSSVSNRTANVICWADAQTGKVDKYGGLAEQRDRLYSIAHSLEDYVRDNPAEKAIFLEAGDGIEGFENTGSQMFTNSLSLMDQVDLEATYEQKYIELLARNHAAVEVYGIDSNHCKWRSGKATLGLPKDDWGRFIKRQLSKAFALNPERYSHVSFDEPGDWDRTLNVDAFGHGIGLAHGDQVNSVDAMPKWWAGQSHGALPVSESEILVTGHFHHYILRQTGRHRNGMQKWHLGLPPLDNGSGWYEGQAGESSDSGLVVFQVSERDGFNFDSLTMLKESNARV